MGSLMTDDKLMIHLLYNLSRDNLLKMILLKKKIGSKENSLEIDELSEELNLRFERLSMQSEYSNQKSL
jgi:hypothetical protein